jgi:antitoxin PrlF
MMAKAKGDGRCAPGKAAGCCRVDSMVSVDSRGQMVLRKELRERAGIGAGDQLAVVTWESGGKVCCISLIRVDELGRMARQLLAPMMKTVLSKEG